MSSPPACVDPANRWSSAADDGVQMRGLKSIRADQAWFWTPEWQAGEREVDAEIAAGKGRIFMSTEELIEHLGSFG